MKKFEYADEAVVALSPRLGYRNMPAENKVLE